MSATAIWLAMAAWTVATIWIATVARRGMGTGAAEFFIGGRRLQGFVSGMTYAATTYSAFMLVGLVGLTYSSGVGALGFEMTYLAFTVIFLLVFGPRFWLVGRRFDHITPPELLAHRFGNKWVAVVAAIISFVMLIPYASVQLMGAGFLVNGLTDGKVPFMAGVLVMAVLSGFSAVWAGMRSVAWTDAVQAMVMLVTSVLALIVVAFSAPFGSPQGFIETITRENPELLEFTWDPKFFIGITLPWAFFALTNPQVAQRLYVPDRVLSLRRMILYFAAFGFIYTIISTLFGFQAAAIVPGLDNPDNAMPQLLGEIPGVLALIIFLGIFAAATSTLGSIILTLSSLFARDVVKHLKPDVTERGETVVGRFALAVLLVACVIFASFKFNLITVLSSMASGGLLVMAPTIIATFYWKRATAPGALISMIVGGVATAVMYIANIYPLGWWPPVWGILLTVILFVVISLVTRPPADAADYIANVDKELEDYGFRLVRRKETG